MPKIIPHLWFDKEAKEATDFYTSIFPDSEITTINTITGTPSGDCDFITFKLSGQEFMAISAGPYFKFNESISFVIPCDTQEEIDYYWEKLSSVKESEQCGWCKDRFGVSWQIVPSMMDRMMSGGTEEQKEKLTQTFLAMKKFDIKKLEDAFNGK